MAAAAIRWTVMYLNGITVAKEAQKEMFSVRISRTSPLSLPLFSPSLCPLTAKDLTSLFPSRLATCRQVDGPHTHTHTCMPTQSLQTNYTELPKFNYNYIILCRNRQCRHTHTHVRAHTHARSIVHHCLWVWLGVINVQTPISERETDINYTPTHTSYDTHTHTHTHTHTEYMMHWIVHVLNKSGHNLLLNWLHTYLINSPSSHFPWFNILTWLTNLPNYQYTKALNVILIKLFSLAYNENTHTLDPLHTYKEIKHMCKRNMNGREQAKQEHEKEGEQSASVQPKSETTAPQIPGRSTGGKPTVHSYHLTVPLSPSLLSSIPPSFLLPKNKTKQNKTKKAPLTLSVASIHQSSKSACWQIC